MGALEFAARFGRLDIDDGSIAGGEQIERTFGVGWTLTRELKLMLNYTNIEASPNRDGIDEDVSLISARLQLAM